MRRLHSATFHLSYAVRAKPFLCAAGILVFALSEGTAADAETIGMAPLRREQPSLTGSGVIVGQPESSPAPGVWQVNPAAVAQPASLFTWIAAGGTATTFPNGVGSESAHANGVGQVLYGGTVGIAPGVQHVRNYEANYYVTNFVQRGVNTPDMIVNNSWIASVSPSMEQAFDSYAANRNVLFVSGMANESSTPPAPASAYNGIGVGLSGAPSSIGPTSDGRAKPDMVVPGYGHTSFATPAVAGAAALLMQAGARGDAGAGTAPLATNSTLIKAMLQNGAAKAAGWSNGVTRPLDARWGAGDLNLYHSWLHLRGGRSPVIATTTVLVDAPHPPTSHAGNSLTRRGWDQATITSTMSSDAIAHYYFNLPGSPGATFLGTATLVWKRASGAASARNLDLFLYHLATTNLVASSQSTIDNVEHLFATNLPPGRYNLQVLKRGGVGQAGTEAYALAFDFISPALTITRSNSAVRIAWPVNQAGLKLESTPSLTPISWQAVTNSPYVTNGQNTVLLPATGSMSYFRLRR